MHQRSPSEPTFLDLATAELGGPRTSALLDKVDAFVPWDAIVDPIRKLPTYAKYVEDPTRPGGRPIDPMVMVRAMFLQKLYNLSDPQAEEQLKDRLSFRRFVGLMLNDETPDETTFVTFRKRLREAGVDGTVFDAVLARVAEEGLLVKQGTIVDATIIEQARGTKTGEKDADGNDLTTRDADAGFTRKHGRSYHGYKIHAATDGSAIITGMTVSSATDHDSRHIDELIKGESKIVYADSAYSDAARRDELDARGVTPGICHKRNRGQAELTDYQKRFNRLVSRVRSIGEHPFAWIKHLMGYRRCRYRGLRRNTFDMVMTVAAYNVKRAVSLLAME